MQILSPPVLADQRRPNTPWPPSDAVRRVLAGTRRRYQGLGKSERPPLRQPQNIVGLFPLADLLVLALCGYWPLHALALRYLAKTPKDRKHRRQRRFDSRVGSVVAEVMVAELPAAVDYLIRGAA
jgi:hypothetical protein